MKELLASGRSSGGIAERRGVSGRNLSKSSGWKTRSRKSLSIASDSKSRCIRGRCGFKVQPLTLGLTDSQPILWTKCKWPRLQNRGQTQSGLATIEIAVLDVGLQMEEKQPHKLKVRLYVELLSQGKSELRLARKVLCGQELSRWEKCNAHWQVPLIARVLSVRRLHTYL
jgi:hypothetical protein